MKLVKPFSTVTFTVSRRKALSMGHTIEEIEKIMNEHVDKLNTSYFKNMICQCKMEV